MTRECPGPDCAEQAAPGQLMCPACWALVPKPLRRAVYIAWKHGAGAGTPAHQAAMTAAIAAANRTYPSSHPEPAASFARAQLQAGAYSSPQQGPGGPYR